MIEWIEKYTGYVESHPKDFNRDVKNNIRQIKMLLKKKGIKYKEADPICFEKFTRECFQHREGELAGQPLVLNMEQRYIAACILGIKEYDKTEKKWYRYFREMDLFVARKWGKDHFVAPLICFFLGLDREPRAWGQIVAENASQSYRTFEIVENEIKYPPLSDVFYKKDTKEKRKIICKINDGKLEYLSGRIKGKDGSNPSFGVANEIHEITNFNQYNAIKTGMGARRQPMMMVISSAGVTPDSLYESLLARNRKMLDKPELGDDDRVFALMYGIDDEDSVEDESCWIKANPAMYEGRPTLEFLRQQWNAMKDDPIMRNLFISKQLNRQIGAASSYYDMISVKNCMSEIKKSEFYDTYAVGGVDLSSTTDLCNATAEILLPEKKLILQAYFVAQDCLRKNSEKDNRKYESYIDMQTENAITAHLVIVNPGATVDYHNVTAWFSDLRDNYNVNFLKIGYDRAMANYWVADMVEHGFAHEKVEFDRDNRVESRDDGILTPCYQGKGLDEAIRYSKSMFEMQKYKVDSANKLLPYCFWSAKVVSDSDNKLSIHKLKSNGHIDGCIGVFNSEVAYVRAKELYKTTEYWSSLEKYFAL